ncbi:MAG: PKD domain-containing protein [Bacteroidetes bacterium]|nr:PKD domain-containing protein [Bacteroidota bacterium]
MEQSNTNKQRSIHCKVWFLFSVFALLPGFFGLGGASFAQVADSTIKIFQFPANMIPRIDGKTDDWAMVPKQYWVGSDQLVEDFGKIAKLDTNDLNITVRVGWVKGLNRLYFLYEATDDYWDFSRTDLHHDIFELVVDGDFSGGPFIDRFHPNKSKIDPMEAYLTFHGVQAQNYHIFTPFEGQDWCLAWGCQPWIKELPWANAAQSYNFRPGQSGKYTLEFWITPFDYAGPEGPSRAVESILKENKNIGLCWAVIDWDGVNNKEKKGFWNISNNHKMYGNASYLRTAKLMPLEPQFRKKIEAQWSFTVLDMDRRLVAFQDKSEGKITSWKWDFGDGTISTEQHPIHKYEKSGLYIVELNVEGPEGKSRRSKVWDVALR